MTTFDDEVNAFSTALVKFINKRRLKADVVAAALTNLTAIYLHIGHARAIGRPKECTHEWLVEKTAKKLLQLMRTIDSELNDVL